MTLSFLQAIYGSYPCAAAQQALCEAVLSYWPDVIGGTLFVQGSWLFWWASHETPFFLVRKPFTLEWWLTAFNIVGSVGFFYGAASGQELVHVDGLVANWVQLLIGYVFGSFFFLLGSYLMIAEVATNA